MHLVIISPEGAQAISSERSALEPMFFRSAPFNLPGLVLFCLLGISAAKTQVDAKAYAFVSPQYIITAEVASAHSFVVNFINLSEFVIVVQPSEIIYRGASGGFYIGQVFEREHKDNRGESIRYSASILLKGRSFTGLTVLGSFHELDQIEEMSIRIGAKRFYLQALDKVQFELLAAKVAELDLENPNPKSALLEANITELGRVESTNGTSEWDRDWEGLLSPDGINPPKIIEKPPVLPTEEVRRSRKYGKIKLSGIINRNGGIQELKVVKGLERGMDERALEAVKNSWVFLPATKNGEVLEVNANFEVDVSPPEAPKTP
jgi:hypothetical protein